MATHTRGKGEREVLMDEHLQFVAGWREGWIMYNGTIIVLYACPDMHGSVYYT